MHYKLKFWDYQFKSLIQFHLAEGSEFNITTVGPKDSTVTISRLDHKSDNPKDFLKYQTTLGNRSVVTYVVNNIPEGVEIRLESIKDGNGVYQTTDDPTCEQIMRDCYLTLTKNLSTFWYQ